MSKQPPPAPTASAEGPCPTIVQTVGRPGTGVYPAPSHHPTTPCLELIFMVPKVFEPLKFYCMQSLRSVLCYSSPGNKISDNRTSCKPFTLIQFVTSFPDMNVNKPAIENMCNFSERWSGLRDIGGNLHTPKLIGYVVLYANNRMRCSKIRREREREINIWEISYIRKDGRKLYKKRLLLICVYSLYDLHGYRIA